MESLVESWPETNSARNEGGELESCEFSRGECTKDAWSEINYWKQAGTNHRALMLHDEIEKKGSGGRVDRKLVGESHAKLGLE